MSATPRSLEVIGAGFGRTGTMSLKAALEELGFGPCYHMTEVFRHPEHAEFWTAAWRGEPVDWDAVLGGYRATVDWPGCTFYAELMERYPEAKVLLNVRDPERWYESMHDTIYELTVVTRGSLLSRIVFAFFRFLAFGAFGTIRRDNMVEEIIWEGTFDGRFEEKAHAIEVFERHNEEVERRVPSGKLLIYQVKEGWGPLCEFLGVEEPDEPFPHYNASAGFRRRLALAGSAALGALALSVAALALLRSRYRR